MAKISAYRCGVSVDIHTLPIQPVSQAVPESFIDIYDSLVRPGAHELVAESVEAGRQALQPLATILLAMGRNVACLTSTPNLDARVLDLYALCESSPVIFTDYFDVDFMWIELTQHLCTVEWFDDVQHLVFGQLRMNPQMIIVLVKCE